MPSYEAIRLLTAPELGELAAQIDEAIESCQLSLDTARNSDHVGRIEKALKHYRAARVQVRNLLALRNGQPLFSKPRPVTTFLGACESLKATNRLLGLLHDEHMAALEVVRLFSRSGARTFDAIDPVAVQVWLDAHALVEAGINDGVDDDGPGVPE